MYLPRYLPLRVVHPRRNLTHSWPPSSLRRRWCCFLFIRHFLLQRIDGTVGFRQTLPPLLSKSRLNPTSPSVTHTHIHVSNPTDRVALEYLLSFEPPHGVIMAAREGICQLCLWEGKLSGLLLDRYLRYLSRCRSLNFVFQSIRIPIPSLPGGPLEARHTGEVV
ncbi:hypothetical protein F5144DRAFT_82198 [Chaetomium tenue]|uniref:Uncharacterized protein n=1 Tax=Chaetomium tenue TaxID=1854479 RepID=A0ACB7PS90_9PEZI|nr:hypothetical protein F5144DRAFT_82198 [Chaetomium globosum]